MPLSFAFAWLGFLLPLSSVFAACPPPDGRKLIWTRQIQEKTLPEGVEVVDRVWIRNQSATPLITYTAEKDAEIRTQYRKVLGDVPTTRNELPAAKLVNGERFEYHFPSNPDFSSEPVRQSGWVQQAYPATLIQPRVPKVPPQIEQRVFAGKIPAYFVNIPIPIYYGRKRRSIDFTFAFAKNPKYGVLAPGCPSPTP